MPSSPRHNAKEGDPTRQADRRRRDWSRLLRATPPAAALVAVALLAAGCGGSNPPAPTGSGGGGAASVSYAKFLAYSRCMRSHGISDFPDPTTSPGGGIAIQLNGGPGSDLNKHNPEFKTATQACRPLKPGAESGTPQQAARKTAAEVKWARCMRSHGLPSFPDPNSQGVFDRSKYNESTPAFQSASKACQSLMNAVGPIPVHP
jgi:hypothetical protein